MDQLENFAVSYNKTYHRSIGMAPLKVNKENETKVWFKLFWPKNAHKENSTAFKLEVNDLVRISYLRRTFEREYDVRWSGELFKVAKRWIRGGQAIYRLNDFNDDLIIGTFYADELQKVKVDEDKMWKIEKIIKTRKTKNKTEHLVRWLYWPKSFDSWVDAKVVDKI